jgi:hypothetical protein
MENGQQGEKESASSKPKYLSKEEVRAMNARRVKLASKWA